MGFSCIFRIYLYVYTPAKTPKTQQNLADPLKYLIRKQSFGDKHPKVLGIAIPKTFQVSE